MAAERVHLTSRDRLAVLGIWVGLGLLESAKAWMELRMGPQPRGWPDVLVGNMPWWLMWAAFSPIVIALARRVRPEPGRRLLFGLTHFSAATLFALLHHVFVGALYFYTVTRGMEFMMQGVFRPMTLSLQIRNFFGGYFMLNLLTYAAIIAAYYGHEYYRLHRRGELRAARLEAGMHQARLAALRMELNPHFLFNTLHAIAGLVRRNDADGAIRMLARLSDLLRATLSHGDDHQVPLDIELELLRTYLEIEQIRFGDRLEITVDADPKARAALVPPLILQPLVENAVRHGVARHSGSGRVEVSAGAHDEWLVLNVTNSGSLAPRTDDDASSGNGIGLANTRQRLAEMYGPRATLSLDELPSGGVRATIRIPRDADAVLTV